MFTVGVLYLVFEDQVLADFKPVRQKKRGEDTSLSRTLVGVQVGLVLLATVVTRSSALSLQAKQGLPRGNQVVAWLVLIVSMLMPSGHRLAPNNHYMHRLLVMFLTCAPTFVILTISYEGLFYVAFCVTLVTWVRLEREVYVFLRSRQPEATATRRGAGKQVNGSAAPKPASSPDTQPSTQPQYRPLGLGDARVALFFFVLLQSAFFSTGNVASVAAFSLDSVYRLIPVFDPFSQGALLMLKIMVPFALLSANLGILNRLLGVSPSALFMLVMAISDVLTLYFFWVVRDEGSWLEIGSTISHFAIASLLCAFVAGLEGVSQMFIAGVRVEADDDDWKRPMANDAVEPAGGPSAEKESKSGNGAAMANGSLGVFAAERIVIR